MRAEHFEGKIVVDRAAQILGEVSGLEIDLTEWKVTHLYVTLDDDSIIALGLKKPRFRGKVEVSLPIFTVNAVSDIVALNKDHDEINELLRSLTNS